MGSACTFAPPVQVVYRNQDVWLNLYALGANPRLRVSLPLDAAQPPNGAEIVYVP